MMMALVVFFVAIVAFVAYILFVSFNEAASLLHTDNAVISPLRNILRTPWLSRYIPMGSPSTEVKQHEWLSHLPLMVIPTFIRTTTLESYSDIHNWLSHSTHRQQWGSHL